MKGRKTRLTEKAKVIKAKLKTPEISLRDLEKETGVPMKTAGRIVKSIPSFDTNGHMVKKLDNIIDMIINIQEISLGKFQEKSMEEGLSTKEVRDLSEIGKTNFERKRLLQGEPTEIKKYDFDLGSKSLLELEQMRKDLLK